MSENLEFGWPDSFLDVWRHEGKDKVSFDGFFEVTDGQEIPAYEFGVQALWVLKVSSGVKNYLVGATIENPGRYGNKATIHIYKISPDGTIEQAEDYYEAPIKVFFNGEGN